MDLRAFLARHRCLAADTMVFIYYLEDHPRYAPLLQPLFQAWEEGRVAGVTSVLTLLEILVKPLREGRPAVARDYRDLLTTYPHLALVPVDAEIAERAADLRARYGLRPPDALQVATALHAGATAFLTNDARLKAVRELEVVLLDELSSP